MNFAHRKIASSFALAATLALITGGLARAGEPTIEKTALEVGGGRGSAPAAFAAASSAGLLPSGTFSGTVVDLSCDSVRPSGGTARCDAGEHFFALKVDGEGGLYPLLFMGNAPSGDKLRAGEYTGRKVRLSGVHHPTTGTILVSEIHPLG